MASILTDLADLFPDTLSVQPGTLSATGAFVPSGAVANYSCYIEGATRLVRDITTGKEVVSTLRAVVASAVAGLTVNLHRYTLPARFNPRLSLRAVSVEKVSDEDGAHHETVHFP